VEGRHLLLDALMSAGDHFIITCDGADLTTNRPLPLPVQVSELLDVVTAMSAAPGDASSGLTVPPIVFRHPRQAFDERNLVADGEHSNGPEAVAAGIPFSFDPGMQFAANTRRSATVSAEQFPILPIDVPATVTVDELTDACVRPARTYLRGRLDVVLPREIDEIDPHIPLDLTKLEMSALGRELLDHHRKGQESDVLESWRHAQRLAGALPPGELGELALQTVERELEIVLDATPEVRELIGASDTHPLDLALTPAEAPDCITQLIDTVTRVHDDSLVRVIFARPKQRGRLTAALELAALTLLQPERDWHAVVVCRPERSSSPNASKEWLRPISGAGRQHAARALLQVAVDLWVRARREPLPLFDQSSAELYADGEFAEESFTADLRDHFNTLLWERYAPDQVLALPIREDDIPGLASMTITDSTQPGRAEALAHLLWGAFANFVVSTSTPPADEEDD
jgi:exodeoxyribonuclease V gamma subunit